jgi:hypothetical protein
VVLEVQEVPQLACRRFVCHGTNRREAWAQAFQTIQVLYVYSILLCVLTSEIQVDGVGEEADAAHALEEGRDGHELEAYRVRRRGHGEQPLRVVARRRVPSPLGVYHRHALHQFSSAPPRSLLAVTCEKLLSYLFAGHWSSHYSLESLLCHLGIEHIERLRDLFVIHIQQSS